MLLNIEKEPENHRNKILRETAQEVPIAEISKPETQKLIDNMIETMYHANGIGIAAPQVGVSKQIIIVETSTGPLALINPKFIGHSLRRVSGEEGCLSVPGQFGAIRRWRMVKVAAYDRQGKKTTLVPKDFTNIILQHEIDHLHGTLFIDKLKT